MSDLRSNTIGVRAFAGLAVSAALMLLFVIMLAACAPGSLPLPPVAVTPARTATPVPASTPEPLSTPTVHPPSSTESTPLAATPTVDRWQEIRLWTPYPFTTPLPPMATTPIDGLYVFADTVHAASRTPCRRCPPYPPLAGVWKLEMVEGIFRVIHPTTGWRTLGSYTTDGDRVTFFNDPNCHLAVGVFDWQRTDDGLSMQLVRDDCELGTRAKLFTGGNWQSCQPSNQEAAVSGHWKTPPGC